MQPEKTSSVKPSKPQPQAPINKGWGSHGSFRSAKKGVPKPQMQIGYKGYIQLAQRTAQYRYINADIVYEGELKKSR